MQGDIPNPAYDHCPVCTKPVYHHAKSDEYACSDPDCGWRSRDMAPLDQPFSYTELRGTVGGAPIE